MIYASLQRTLHVPVSFTRPFCFNFSLSNLFSATSLIIIQEGNRQNTMMQAEKKTTTKQNKIKETCSS